MWEDLPTDVRLALTPATSPESQAASSASLFPNDGLPPHERRLLSLLKADEAAHIDELIEKLETENVFLGNLCRPVRVGAEWESAANAGKNFVKSF